MLAHQQNRAKHAYIPIHSVPLDNTCNTGQLLRHTYSFVAIFSQCCRCVGKRAGGLQICRLLLLHKQLFKKEARSHSCCYPDVEYPPNSPSLVSRLVGHVQSAAEHDTTHLAPWLYCHRAWLFPVSSNLCFALVATPFRDPTFDPPGHLRPPLAGGHCKPPDSEQLELAHVHGSRRDNNNCSPGSGAQRQASQP